MRVQALQKWETERQQGVAPTAMCAWNWGSCCSITCTIRISRVRSGSSSDGCYSSGKMLCSIQRKKLDGKEAQSSQSAAARPTTGTAVVANNLLLRRMGQDFITSKPISSKPRSICQARVHSPHIGPRNYQVEWRRNQQPRRTRGPVFTTLSAFWLWSKAAPSARLATSAREAVKRHSALSFSTAITQKLPGDISPLGK